MEVLYVLLNYEYDNMNPDQVRELVQQEIANSANLKQYTVAPVSYHTHNGIDSQKFPFLNLKDVPNSYSGKAGNNVIVNSTGTGLEFSLGKTYYMGQVVSGAAGAFFPDGWSVANPSTGLYNITHTLSTSNYSASALTISGSVAHIITGHLYISPTTFQLEIYNNSGSSVNDDFVFTVFT